MNYLICTIKSIFNWTLEIVFPQECLGCDKKGEIICLNCILKIKRAERETESNIIACFDYRESIIKKAIWNLKYHGRFAIGKILGELLYENLLEDISEIRMYTEGSPILVIPAPLFKTRQKERGYNQAEIIASSFCNSKKEIFELKNNIVVKQKNTEQQAKLTNKNKRLKNTQGAFKVINTEDVKGRTIIVIDDVTTTGGTILEIIKVLKKSGAKKVIGFAVAH